MCVPCKIIFNQGLHADADLADTLREMLVEETITEVEREGLLLRLAQAEQMFHVALGGIIVDLSRLVTDDKGWHDLIDKRFP